MFMSSLRPSVLAHLEYQKHSQQLRKLELKNKFEYIYAQNVWGSCESVSGLGSELAATLLSVGSFRNSARNCRFVGSWMHLAARLRLDIAGCSADRFLFRN